MSHRSERATDDYRHFYMLHMQRQSRVTGFFSCKFFFVKPAYKFARFFMVLVMVIFMTMATVSLLSS